jgi:hypothetical protein
MNEFVVLLGGTLPALAVLLAPYWITVQADRGRQRPAPTPARPLRHDGNAVIRPVTRQLLEKVQQA